MALEMSCASCDGRLMVETLGVVVACPHCGTHLSIPAEIPGVTPPETDKPAPTPPEEPLKNEDLVEKEEKESLENEDLVESDDSEDEASSDSEPGSKTTWFPDPQDEGPGSFPDFSKLGETQESTAESNVLVAETEAASDDEVPSAVHIPNADPSDVLPAIITDATVAASLSGFPVLGESVKPEEPAPEESEDSTAETEQADVTEEVPVVPETVQMESPFPTVSEVAAPINDEPSVTESVETVDIPGGFPSLGDNDDEETAAVPSISEPVETTAPESETPAQPTRSQSVPAYDSPPTYDSALSSRRGKLIPNPVFQAWMSYTILVTGGLAMAIYSIFSAPTSRLESLPDLKPRATTKAGKIVGYLIPEDARMPDGHTLKLSETQRFGNIEVTPVKVTKDELVLVGASYVDASRKILKEGQVLKLWVKFKNVSRDQVIAPLDSDLLFFREYRKRGAGGLAANHFVCQTSEKKEQGDLAMIYDHAVEGDYRLQKQKLGQELKPGEEVMIYLPTETGVFRKLKGDLIWRVHFRKGYSPKNYGVTTVFEVQFHSDDIQTDTNA